MSYPGCRFCGGRGCLACEGERQRAFEQVQDPIFTASTDDPRDMQLLKTYLGKDALDHAFGPDGHGIQEIERNAAIASFLQAVHVREESDDGE